MITRLRRFPYSTHKTSILLVVTCLNFLFVGVDVLMAHSQSGFFRWALIPLVYSPVAVLAILAQLRFRASAVVRRTFQTVMWCGVGVGVAGTFLHFHGNATGGQDSLHRLLIEGSPFAAPIAFAGIALYALAVERYSATVRRSRLLALVGLGFLGAVAAAFLDHARLSFLPSTTLIPLVTGTVAAMSCFFLARGRTNHKETHLHLCVLALSALVGLVGFGFHVLGNLAGTESIVWARVLYRNPVLGPLLFCDLALLGALSILPEPHNATSDQLRAPLPEKARCLT